MINYIIDVMINYRDVMINYRDVMINYQWCHD